MGGKRWVAPPSWPAPPSPDWSPPAGWQPDPAWGPPPLGWVFWQSDAPSKRRVWLIVAAVFTPLLAVVVGVAVSNATSSQSRPAAQVCTDAVNQATTLQAGVILYREGSGDAATYVQNSDRFTDTLRNDQASTDNGYVSSAIQRVVLFATAVRNDVVAGEGFSSDASELDASVTSLRAACR